MSHGICCVLLLITEGPSAAARAGRRAGYLAGQMLLVQVRKSTTPGLWQSSHELVAHDVETFTLSSVFLPNSSCMRHYTGKLSLYIACGALRPSRDSNSSENKHPLQGVSFPPFLPQ